jgi:formylglycine-generating enzyme required for sulfatase activity
MHGNADVKLMRGRGCRLILALCFATFTINLGAERVALVVGCGNYTAMPGRQLMSPAKDSEDVASALKLMGYRLIGGGAMNDLGRDKLKSALKRLAMEAKNAEAAVFYFSGHGVQIGGENYILPIDTKPVQQADQLRAKAISVRESVLVELEASRVETKVVVLDCCRDNPFSAQGDANLPSSERRGKSFVEMRGYGPGFYLAFSTSPGGEAFDGNGSRNSPFTESFLENLGKSADKDIDLFFRDVKRQMPADQVSWTSSSLKKEFSLSLSAQESSRSMGIFNSLRAGNFAGESYTNGMEMGFRWCPSGEFLMGSSAAEQAMAKKWGWESAWIETQHRVRLTRGYWMKECEVTQGEWRRVMGTGVLDEAEAMLRSEREVGTRAEPYKMRDFYEARPNDDPRLYAGVEDDNYPMIYIDWDGAVTFCEQLTQMEIEGRWLPPGWRYALPTEAQWEYACRAGSKDAVYAGQMEIIGVNNAPVLDRIAWYGGNSAVGYTGNGLFFRGRVTRSGGLEGMAYAGGVCGPRRCGEKAANRWGLRDMIGNVNEWCLDWSDEYSVKWMRAAADPVGPTSGELRVFRGGCWYFGAAECRAAFRGSNHPGSRNYIIGFRPVIVPSRD